MPPSAPSTTIDAVAESGGHSFARLLADVNVRRLWTSQAFTSAGESLGQIALPLLVYDMTESARMVGLIALFLIGPRVVFAPICGLLADILDRLRIMISADALRLVVALLIPLATSIWQLGALAVVYALGNSLGRPAEMAAIPAVAGPGRLVPTLSLMQVSNGVIRIVVPAAGAALIAVLGAGPVFWVQAVMFALSIVALRNLRIPREAPPEGWQLSGRALVRRASREMWAGLAAIGRIPIVRGITASEALFQIAIAAMIVTGVVYTQETLDLGDRAEAAFALMTTALSAGAVLGALVAHRIERRLGRPTMMALGYMGPFFLTIAILTPPMPVIYVAWFVFGMMDALAVISFQAYLAEAVPEDLRGRVFAAWGAIVSLSAAIFLYLYGYLTEWLGAPGTFLLSGLIVGIGGPLLLLVTGALRSVRGQGPVAVPLAPDPT